MNNWINVNDRLPDYRERVICYYVGLQPKMSGPETGVMFRHETVDPLREKNQFAMCSEVLYWQPLPEAPNKKSVGNHEDGMIDGISQERDERLLRHYSQWLNENALAHACKDHLSDYIKNHMPKL